MSDLYFNELSINFKYSTTPSSKEDAKDILLQFVKTSLAYVLSIGSQDSIYILLAQNFGRFSDIRLFGTCNIFQLLKELEDDGKLESAENSFFQAMVAESFEEGIEPEYKKDTIEVFGLGEAYNKESYAISFTTHSDWDQAFIKVVKISLNYATNSIITAPVEVMHISNLSHVFKEHKIWESCQYKLDSPSRLKLPNKNASKFIIQTFGYNDWNEFYSQLSGGQGITAIKDIGKAVATINGWSNIGLCKNRESYECKNYHLALDTQHATFEVYCGKDHQGEMKFHDETLSKKDDRRKWEC